MTDLPPDSHFSHIAPYSWDLRKKAETLKTTGNTPTSLKYVLGPDALAALFKLASSPDTAHDGLKLLHELQTHQIELDLQHEQSLVTERETAAELARYKALYEYAPTGYFVINREGRIIESNRLGADLLGVPCNDLNGSLFQAHLTPACQQIFSWKLKKLFSGSAHETSTLQTIDGRKMPSLCMWASPAPDGEAVLMNISTQESPPPH